MAKRSTTKIGQRDVEILSALDRCPLTPAQLLLLSEIFRQPYTDENHLRRRLRQLSETGLLRSWPMVSMSYGRSPSYFKLTRDGYRMLYGLDCAMPKRRYFEQIAPAHHHHTQSLADFIIHTSRLAHARGWSVQNFARENSVRFEVHGRVLLPDACFEVVTPERSLHFVVELDNGTERVRSRQDVESIQRKIEGYDLHSSQYRIDDPSRYFVLFVTTRSQQRVEHIVAATQELMQNPQRSTFYVTDLGQFLASQDLLTERVFTDNTGRRRSLIRGVNRVPQKARQLDDNSRFGLIPWTSCREAQSSSAIAHESVSPLIPRRTTNDAVGTGGAIQPSGWNSE